MVSVKGHRCLINVEPSIIIIVVTCAILFYRSAAIDKLMLGGQSKTWILSNALVTITTSRGSDNDGYHGSPVSCIHCGWAEVLIRRPTGNISWLMRLQNQVGGAVASAHLNANHTNESTDVTSSLLTTPAVSRTGSNSSTTELTTDTSPPVDILTDNSDTSNDQQFPIEVDGDNISTPTPTNVDEPHPPKSATKAAAFVHTGELQQQRCRHTSLEFLPPLMSYEESHTKSPSLHGGSGHLTDEEQVYYS